MPPCWITITKVAFEKCKKLIALYQLSGRCCFGLSEPRPQALTLAMKARVPLSMKQLQILNGFSTVIFSSHGRKLHIFLMHNHAHAHTGTRSKGLSIPLVTYHNRYSTSSINELQYPRHTHSFAPSKSQELVSVTGDRLRL